MSSYSAMMPPPLPNKEKNGVPEAFVYRGGDDLKQGEVKEQFAKFFQETSFTALVRIYNASSFVKRVAWLVVFLGMLGWLTTQCYWLLSRYFSYPMEVKMDLLAAQELEFPSITVCNLNPLKESKFHGEPFFSALAAPMELRSVDTLYTMFSNYYYNDWQVDYQREQMAISEAMRHTTNYPMSTQNSGQSTPEDQTGLVPGPTSQPTVPSGSSGSAEEPGTSAVPVGPGSSQSQTTTPAGTGPGTQNPPTPAPTSETIQTTGQPSTSPGSAASTPTTQETIVTDTDPPTTMNMGFTPPPEGNGQPHPNGRRKRQADISTFLKAKSFNKWDALDHENASTTFYEDRDQEYIASMAYAVFSQKTDPKIMIQGGHPANDFFIDCKMGGFPCSPKNFTTFVNHKYGNCFTFNAAGNGQKLKTRFAGPAYGLSLELYLNQKEYIPALAPAAGARVLIHPRNSMPFPEDEGISIAPGFSTSIGVRKVDITRLPPPHGLCATSGKTKDLYKTNLGTDYSKLSCLKSCYQELAMKYCNCSVPQYYVAMNNTVCNMTNFEQEMCSKKLPDLYPADYTQCDTNCPQPCSEVRYEKTVSIAQWPSDKYAKHLQSRVQQSNYMFYGNEVDEEDFAKVEIYFEDLLYQSVQQQKAYESQNLISDIGGQLGLWLGLSAITLGELFSFLFSLGQALTRGVLHHKKKHSTPIEPVNMGPVSYM